MSFTGCDITSSSGRGIVATRGASVTVSDCNLHDSAATGFYIGGEGTQGEIKGCTVTENGKGGERVLRGHSGVFVDRAKLLVKKCSVKRNHLTGISLVGEGSYAQIEDTYIEGNATAAIDAPPGQVSFRGSNNVVNSNPGEQMS